MLSNRTVSDCNVLVSFVNCPWRTTSKEKRYKLFHSACHVKHISLFHNSDQLKYVFIITMYRNKNIKKTYYLKDEKIEDRYTFDKIL